MKEKVILYRSNTGHTAQYAKFLASEIGIPAVPFGDEDLKKGTPVVYLAWIYGGRPVGLKKALEKYEIRAIGIVGMSREVGQISKVRKMFSLPETTKVFYLPGGLEMDKLHGMKRLVMKFVSNAILKRLNRKTVLTPDEEAIIDDILHGGPKVDIRRLGPMVRFLKEETL